MRAYSLTLAVNAQQSIDVSGNFFRIVSASAGVKLSVQMGTGPYTPMDAGNAIKLERTEFTRLTVKSSVAQTVVIVAGYGTMYDDQQSVSVTSSATITPGNTLDNGGDVSLVALATTAVRAADAKQLAVIIKADIANTATIRVGTTAVGAAKGYPLEPGESVTIATTAAIAAYNPDAAAQNVHVLPVRNV